MDFKGWQNSFHVILEILKSYPRLVHICLNFKIHSVLDCISCFLSFRYKEYFIIWFESVLHNKEKSKGKWIHGFNTLLCQSFAKVLFFLFLGNHFKESSRSFRGCVLQYSSHPYSDSHLTIPTRWQSTTQFFQWKSSNDDWTTFDDHYSWWVK